MPSPRRPLHGLTALRVGALLLTFGGAVVAAHAQTVPTKSASAAATPRPPTEQGPSWNSLKPAQREALKPLERDWTGIDAARKSKWLEIADRYPTMAPPDRQRLQARMTEWTRMTPLERNQTRLQFQDARQVPQQDRQASWEAYQALPEEQRRELASRAQPAGVTGTASKPAPTSTAAAAPRPDKLAREGPQPKVNAVPAPGVVPPPKPVAPSVVQVQPGATTTLISKPAAPPAHQPSGSPKIAATPDYVDKKTLLPQTGPQSAGQNRPPAAAPKAERQ